MTHLCFPVDDNSMNIGPSYLQLPNYICVARCVHL